jgi:hypothetical protein
MQCWQNDAESLHGVTTKNSDHAAGTDPKSCEIPNRTTAPLQKVPHEKNGSKNRAFERAAEIGTKREKHAADSVDFPRESAVKHLLIYEK